MLFVEFRFFVFFALVFCVHWTLRSNTARKVWLLACSHFFYACFFIGSPQAFLAAIAAGEWGSLPAGWWFPLVLLGSTCMDYGVGLGMDRTEALSARRTWLGVSLAVNIGVLCYFKYCNFFILSASSFLDWIGLPVSWQTLKIILPYGISFYTFQSMSYTIEVYRRHRPAERRFLDLALFIAFFPQLVAGPIVRALVFLPQTKVAREFMRDVDVRGALVQFLVGFVKKTCIAEAVAPSVDQYFAAPASFTAMSAWIAILLYAVQIYCDFSGYTDMAIASARLLGYELTVNFNFPYLARNVTEFWRRWHISLSTWLRDYLYISLGGNRGSRLFTYRNLLLTMLLGGLWHGAAWGFVLWGALHGAALVVHREWSRRFQRAFLPPQLTTILGVAVTFYFTCICWIFFRADTFGNARVALTAFTSGSSNGSVMLDQRLWLLFGGLVLVHWLNYKRVFQKWWRHGSDPLFAVGYGAAIALVLLFLPQKYTPFIYFQF